MLMGGYDTDDLTDRQNFVFHKLRRKGDGTTLVAMSFLKSSVEKNFRLQKFDNYDGDCSFLDRFTEAELKEKYGIDKSTLYS